LRNLKEHLEELKVLYSEIPQSIHIGAPQLVSSAWVQEFAKFANFVGGESKKNPNYPIENYQEFVRRMLDEKKKLIEHVLGIPK
jgi:hypothetical protein